MDGDNLPMPPQIVLPLPSESEEFLNYRLQTQSQYPPPQLVIPNSGLSSFHLYQPTCPDDFYLIQIGDTIKNLWKWKCVRLNPQDVQEPEMK